jgi:hypothetical protein
MASMNLNNLSTIKKLVTNHVLGVALGWFHNDKRLLMVHGVIVIKTQQLSPFSQFVSSMLFFLNISIVNPNNEQHNFENKTWKMLD